MKEEIVNMREIKTLRELQIIETSIFRDILCFCKEHNIGMNVLGGTLIGAVRHKGFIPWDDDIDLSISRPDYEKIVSLHNSGIYISENCYLMSAETDDNYNGYIPQIVLRNSKMRSDQYREEEDLKIGVSVFIFDGVPDNILARKLFYIKIFVLRSLHALCRSNFKYVNSRLAKKVGPILQPLFDCKDTKKYRDMVIKLGRTYSYSKSKYVAPNLDTDAFKEICERKVFEKREKLSFEGLECYAPSNYLDHLRRYYGDFMKLPPEHARIAKHRFKAWIE